MCFSLVVFLGSGGRKKYFVAGAHFLLLFASVMRHRRTFDRDGWTDRQTRNLYTHDKPRGAAPRGWPASSPLCCFFVERERERESSRSRTLRKLSVSCVSFSWERREKKIICGGSSFLASFCICNASQNKKDTGRTDRQTDIIFIIVLLCVVFLWREGEGARERERERERALGRWTLCKLCMSI